MDIGKATKENIFIGDLMFFDGFTEVSKIYVQHYGGMQNEYRR